MKNLFNKGLAQLLNKDFQNAASSFNDAIQKDNSFALAHYGAAIAAARLDRADDVVKHLTNAVQADSSLKADALADIEFAKFAATETFRNALR